MNVNDWLEQAKQPSFFEDENQQSIWDRALERSNRRRPRLRFAVAACMAVLCMVVVLAPPVRAGISRFFQSIATYLATPESARLALEGTVVQVLPEQRVRRTALSERGAWVEELGTVQMTSVMHDGETVYFTTRVEPERTGVLLQSELHAVAKQGGAYRVLLAPAKCRVGDSAYYEFVPRLIEIKREGGALFQTFALDVQPWVEEISVFLLFCDVSVLQAEGKSRESIPDMLTADGTPYELIHEGEYGKHYQYEAAGYVQIDVPLIAGVGSAQETKPARLDYMIGDHAVYVQSIRSKPSALEIEFLVEGELSRITVEVYTGKESIPSATLSDVSRDLAAQGWRYVVEVPLPDPAVREFRLTLRDGQYEVDIPITLN